MINVRKGNERGLTQTDWLKSYHTFSFGEYYEPRFMGFGPLRVINEDTVAPGKGFGTHAHQEMEIISYVVEGAIDHKDSTGTGSTIFPGEIQRMSAGSGVTHSEFNHSKDKSLHFLQIWIIPNQSKLLPSYQQKKISPEKNRLTLIGSPQGEEGVIIHQNVLLYVAFLTTGAMIHHASLEHTRGWIQLIKGTITLNDIVLTAGDGAAFQDENPLTINCLQEAEFLLFDL